MEIKKNEVRLLAEENEKLKKELGSTNEKIMGDRRGADEDFQLRLKLQTDLLVLEQDQDRGAYQKLLKDYNELEQRNEILEQKLAAFVPGHSRSLSNTSSGSGQANASELPADEQNIVRNNIYHLFDEHQLFHLH